MTTTERLLAYCKERGVYPHTLRLLVAFSQTPEGRRFVNGAPLRPIAEPRKPNPRRKAEGSQRGLRPARMTLDWIDDDEA
jgi:hypothetical protein